MECCIVTPKSLTRRDLFGSASDSSDTERDTDGEEHFVEKITAQRTKKCGDLQAPPKEPPKEPRRPARVIADEPVSLRVRATLDATPKDFNGALVSCHDDIEILMDETVGATQFYYVKCGRKKGFIKADYVAEDNVAEM